MPHKVLNHVVLAVSRLLRWVRVLGLQIFGGIEDKGGARVLWGLRTCDYIRRPECRFNMLLVFPHCYDRNHLSVLSVDLWDMHRSLHFSELIICSSTRTECKVRWIFSRGKLLALVADEYPRRAPSVFAITFVWCPMAWFSAISCVCLLGKVLAMVAYVILAGFIRGCSCRF